MHTCSSFYSLSRRQTLNFSPSRNFSAFIFFLKFLNFQFFLNCRGQLVSLTTQAMAVDKKVADGELRLILLKGDLGGCVLTGEFDEAAMRATIQDFCDRQ